MRNLSIRQAAVAIAVLVLCWQVLPARGDALTWHFSVIAQANGPAAFGSAAINSSGEVAFARVQNMSTWGTLMGQDTVCKGVVGSVETVADTWGGFDVFGLAPTINDLGDVAFEARHGPGHSIVVRYTDATQGYTYIAEANFNDPNALYSTAHSPSINNSGTVAFSGVIADTGDRFLAVGNGGAVSYVDVLPYGWGYRSVMIQREGPTLELAWATVYGHPGPTSSRIQKGATFSHTTIAEGTPTSTQFLEVESPSINDLGYVSFVADLAGGGQAVYYGTGGSPFLVADTTGEFGGFQATAISNDGIAFYGWLDYGGTQGIFTGPNGSADKVLTVGDTIAGIASPVVSVSLSCHGMNNAGQIALNVKFADGTYRIVRADPYVLQQIPEGLLSVGVIKTALFAHLFQTSQTSGGQEDLSFDYFFGTTTGQLVVTVGGVEVGRIDAPSDRAGGFATFRTLVDVESLFPDGPDELLLEFSLAGGGDTSGLYLDNIVFGRLSNGDFATGNLTGWRTTAGEGGVGVSVDPTYVAIPEPGTLGLLAVGAAMLCRWRKR